MQGNSGPPLSCMRISRTEPTLCPLAPGRVPRQESCAEPAHLGGSGGDGAGEPDVFLLYLLIAVAFISSRRPWSWRRVANNLPYHRLLPSSWRRYPTRPPTSR